VSYAREIEPIVSETCAQCHTAEGPGTPHLRLESAGDVAAAAELAASLVASGAMPPWPASPESIAFTGDWSLTDPEIQAIVDWAAEGAWLDVEPDRPIVPQAVFRLDDPDTVITAARGFDGRAGDDDQYRCFVYDPELEEEAWITAYEFVPDQAAVVHHAIGYLAPASARKQADRREAEDDAGGWECFGASGIGLNEIFLGWAPGQGPLRMPEGSGLRLGAGEFLVVQIHYHFDVDAPEDRSALALELAEAPNELDEVVVEQFAAPAEIPCGEGESGQLCDRSAALANALEKYGRRGVAADGIFAACGGASSVSFEDGVASGSCVNPIRAHGQIVSVLGHEHELGKSFRMTLNPGSAEELVLLDIPRWDFSWQLNYHPREEIVVGPGDSVLIECSWDRSLRDAELEPAYVLWADGTDDEMCFATMTVRQLRQ
jgi:hypothetical protein